MKLDGKTALAAASALALASMGAAPLAAVAAPASSPAAEPAAVAAAEVAQVAPGAKAQAVAGTFAYTQDAVTSTAQLRDVFSKSAAALCQALPDYGCAQCASALLLRAPGSPEIQATVADLAGEDAAGGVLMACSCATNAPGGGATANAEAQGVMLKALAALMGA